jgi:hypothetical protein
MSAVALGVGLDSCTHRGWYPSSERISVRTLRQSYITPHCIKCRSSHSQAHFVSSHRFAPFGFTQQALCKIAYAGAVTSRRRFPVASRPTRRRLSPWWCAGVVAYVRRFAHGFIQRLRRVSCMCPRPPLGLTCFASLARAVCPSSPQGGSLRAARLGWLSALLLPLKTRSGHSQNFRHGRISAQNGHMKCLRANAQCVTEQAAALPRSKGLM